MLKIKELTIKDYQHDLILVDNLTFILNENEKIAIIGNEGSGKSTLLKIIKGDELPHIIKNGEISKPRVFSYIDQNIRNNWNEYSVEEYFSHGNYSVYQYLDNIYKLFSLFNLSYNEIKSRKIKTFSGGEIVKIGIVKALMNEPDLLLLDEPSNDLDFETLIFLENFLRETTIPVLFISHDQRLLENVATGIIHLQHVQKKTKPKTIFMNIDYKTYKEKYIKKFESELMIARKQRADYDKKMLKFRQIYQKVEYQQNQAVRDPSTARLLKKRMHVLKSQEKRYLKEKFLDIPEKEEAVNIFFQNNSKINKNKNILDLEVKDFKFKNNQVIKDIKLQLKGNDKVVIIGENGIGKTTLMTSIYDELIKKNIKVGYISQNYLDVLDENEIVIDYLMNNQQQFDQSRIRQILGTLGFKKVEMLYEIKRLSEGSKLKILLLLITLNEYDILLLDEVTRNISPINQNEVYNLFLSFKGAIIAITHDREFIEKVFDDVYELTREGLFKK